MHFAKLLKSRQLRRDGPRWLPLGIAETSILPVPGAPPLDLEAKFRMVKQAGVFDYVEATPPPDQVGAYQRASKRFALPIRAGGGVYIIGRDEALLEQNLKIAGVLGSQVHNMRIAPGHAAGRRVSDTEVIEVYHWARSIGRQVGCEPSLGIQIDTWAEDFGRVRALGSRIRQRDMPFLLTLDPGDIIFKINNPREQQVCNLGPAVAGGTLVLDPDIEGHVAEDWLARGYVAHCHARPAIPNNPPTPAGRGAQYPFIQPEPGAYQANWEETQLATWKRAMRQVMAYHASHADSPLGQITTTFSDSPDHAGDATYALFENAVACASWLRETWLQALATEAAKAR